ncbi:MAG: hypothetical protein HFG75_07025 [Hungatella sp.]|nr:hypothetical protein [Hungatella sp.]
MKDKEKNEQIDHMINRLSMMRRVLFLWQMGLEYIRSDGTEDVTAAFEMLTEQMLIMQEELEKLRA